MIGGGGSPGGTNAGLFLPPNQGAAAQGYTDMTRPLFEQGLNAFNQMQGISPAQQAWPDVYSSTQNILRNPYLGDAVSGGVFARDIFANQMLPQAGAIAGMMNNPAYAQAGQLGQQFSPQYAQLMQQALGYASDPSMQQAQQFGTNAANQLGGAAGNILNTAFDPRQELYNRTAQQIRDQQNAINAQSGVASSPYGAGLAGQRMQDFNIDWQNQQLQRQALGGQAAGQLYGQGIQDILNPAIARGNALQLGGGLAGTMGNQAMQSLMMGPNAQLAAQQSGLGLLGGLAQAAPGMMGASYNAFNQPQQANLAALQNQIQLGNQMYGPAQAAASNLSNYMGLGQSASNLANQIGQTNFNEAMGLGSGITQGLGALGGSNLLFGSGGLSGALGLGSGGLLGALFGGGGGASALSALGGAGEAAVPTFFAEAAAAPEALLPWVFSDRRLKTDIERLGQLDYGPAIYSFKYRGSDQPQIGLMADEVEAFNPDAVLKDARGFGMVDYSKALRPVNWQ